MLNKNIKILLYSANLWYFGEGMFGPLFAVFAEKIGGDILDISWAWATYLIVAGLLYIVVGKITDVYNNKEKVMILGYILNTLFTFGYLLVSAPWHLFVIQAGLGVAVALATPTWQALYAKNGDKNNSGFEWGLSGGMDKIITGLAMVVGGYIVNFISFNALFLTMGLLQILATVYQTQILKIKINT